METIQISRKSAEAVMEILLDHTYWAEGMTAESRREVIALDEIVNALNAENRVTEYLQEKEAEMARYRLEAQKSKK